MNVLSVLGRAIVAFAATNIDDIFVLTLFFAQKNLKRWHIVVGQYLGIGGLISISLVGPTPLMTVSHAGVTQPLLVESLKSAYSVDYSSGNRT